MNTKSTDELENVLGSTHIENVDKYLSGNKESLINTEKAFACYVHQYINEKHLKQQDIFLEADIPERYGYKLLSEEKRTKQRDIIIRLCYAMKMNLEETQKALKLYRMPTLYAKIPRDAVLIIAFNQRPGSIIDVNSFLKSNGMDQLRTSGVQE